MAKKAVLRFSTLEYRYQDTYGIMPDYDFDRLVSSGMSCEEAGRTVNGRINEVYAKMKYEHEHRHELEQRHALQELEKECPF